MIQIQSSFHLKKFNRTSSFFSIFIIFILLFCIFPTDIAIQSYQTTNNDLYISKDDRLLILLKNPSVIDDMIQTSDVNTIGEKPYIKLSDFTNITLLRSIQHRVISLQDEVKQSISQVIDQRDHIIWTNQFSLLSNIIVLTNISDSSLNKIKTLPFVEDIFIDTKISLNSDTINHVSSYTSNYSNQETISNSPTNQSSVRIAFFDTGVDYTHPALSAQYIGGYDFVQNDFNPMDDNGHGTHCAGIALARKNEETRSLIQGVAPFAMYYAYKVLDSQGNGYISWFLDAFEYALDPNQDGNFSDSIDIISISAGDPEGNENDLLSIAAQNAVTAGITVVAAAGNYGPQEDTISSPACAPHVIAVGATDNNSKVASFSSRGSSNLSTIKPNIVAPGVNIQSTWLNHGYKILSGTSMSCPYIAGYCAILLQQNPSLNPYEIEQILKSNAQDIGYNATTQGYGEIKNILPNPDNNVLFANISKIKYLNNSTLRIYGTANGSSFSYYTILYQPETNQNTKSDQWIYLINRSIPVSNDLLYTWNYSLVNSGSYLIKLEAVNLNNKNIAYTYVQLSKDNFIGDIQIIVPSSVIEGETFQSILLSNSNKTERGLFIFLVPLKKPMIRIGTDVFFTAPRILLPSKETLQSKLYIFLFNQKPFQMFSKEIIIQSRPESNV